MVKGDDVALIDVSFGEIRPSPWRQAVDLANIMLVLALRTDADTVYERALLQFTPTDIGEAFAATRGVTLPSQLRDDMKADGRRSRRKIPGARTDVPTHLNSIVELASRRPDRVGVVRRACRRLRRVGLPAACGDAAMRKVTALAVIVLLAVAVIGAISAMQNDTSEANVVPGTACPTNSVNDLVAQSVPSASLVPCVALFGARWSVDGEDFTSHGTKVSMTGHDSSADVTWKVTFDESCDTSGMTPAGDTDGAAVSQSEESSGSSTTRTQALVFDGGCVTSKVVIPSRFDHDLVIADVDAALVLVPRSALNAQVRAQTDGRLQLDP